MVNAVSTPNPAANGSARPNATRLSARCPDNGCTGANPVARWMPARARRTTKPCPPPAVAWVGSVAMVMSARPSSTGGSSGPAPLAVSPRSASRNSSTSASGTAAAPVVIAAALPRLRGWRTARAPAASAIAAVLSVEPSSTTSTVCTPAMRAAACTVAAIRSASLRAGITTATRTAGSANGELPTGQPVAGATLVGGQRGVVGQRLADALAHGLGRVLELGRLLVRGQLPDRGEQALAAERADVAGALAQAVRAGHVQPGESLEQRRLVLRHDPAQPRLVPLVAPVGGLHRGESGGRRRGGVGLLQRLLDLRGHLVRVLHPEQEPVVHRDVQRDGRVDELLQLRGVRLDLHRRGSGAGVDGQRGQQRGGDLSARVTGWELGLHGDQHRALRAGQAGQRQRQHGDQGDVTIGVVPDEFQRGSGRGHDFPHRDQVALRGHALERAQHEALSLSSTPSAGGLAHLQAPDRSPHGGGARSAYPARAAVWSLRNGMPAHTVLPSAHPRTPQSGHSASTIIMPRPPGASEARRGRLPAPPALRACPNQSAEPPSVTSMHTMSARNSQLINTRPVGSGGACRMALVTISVATI